MATKNRKNKKRNPVRRIGSLNVPIACSDERINLGREFAVGDSNASKGSDLLEPIRVADVEAAIKAEVPANEGGEGIEFVEPKEHKPSVRDRIVNRIPPFASKWYLNGRNAWSQVTTYLPLALGISGLCVAGFLEALVTGIVFFVAGMAVTGYKATIGKWRQRQKQNEQVATTE